MQAGLRAGLALAYGCSNGNCGLCQGRLISGEVKTVRHTDYVLTTAERARGNIVMCGTGLVTDAAIEAPEAGGGDVPWQEIRARVTRVDPLSDQVSVLHLKTPRTQRLRFLAGQYVTLSLNGGEFNSDYSVASCPCDDMRLQFHIPRNDDDAFSCYVHGNLGKSDVVGIKGPAGDFYFREQSERPIVFVAMDTGFAPIRSLVEQAMALEVHQDMSLYWMAQGENGANGHYLDNLCRSWSAAFDNLRYRPMVVGPGCKEMADAILDRLKSDLTGTGDIDTYLSGPAEILPALKSGLENLGWAPERVFTEPLRHNLSLHRQFARDC